MTLIHSDKLACKAHLLRLSLRTFFVWEWLGPGGLPGLQNLWRVALRAAVGSTPIHSRLKVVCHSEPRALNGECGEESSIR